MKPCVGEFSSPFQAAGERWLISQVWHSKCKALAKSIQRPSQNHTKTSKKQSKNHPKTSKKPSKNHPKTVHFSFFIFSAMNPMDPMIFTLPRSKEKHEVTGRVPS